MSTDGYIRPEFDDFGPRYDYRGAHALTAEGRLVEITGLLTVIDRNWTVAAQATIAHCRYFNGEAAPDELLSTLRLLDRTAPERGPDVANTGRAGHTFATLANGLAKDE